MLTIYEINNTKSDTNFKTLYKYDKLKKQTLFDENSDTEMDGSYCKKTEFFIIDCNKILLGK